MSYKFLEHTSDLIVEAKGKTFREALEEAARAMITQMGAEEASKKEKIKIELPSPQTKEDIVVATLTEIIASCDSEPFTPAEVKISIGKIITVQLSGERKTPTNIIKAVTYHGLKIERKKDWKITVLFDI
ncbi:MAG: archease [Candidatus Bilamarchaeaceae archaeon]